MTRKAKSSAGVAIIDSETEGIVAVGQDYPAARDFCLAENGRLHPPRSRFYIDRNCTATKHNQEPPWARGDNG